MIPDVVGYLSVAIVSYYCALFVASLWTTRRPGRGSASDIAAASPLFALVIPAHNEALVISETVRRARALRADRLLILVMNDGSADATSALARQAAESDPRVLIVDRPPELAGQGKGEVLNHAYRILCAMVARGDHRLHGATPDEVVMSVVDADGWLEPQAPEVVAPYFADPRVGGVQLPVRVWNARDGLLARMQDIEFIGFSLFVQAGRDPFGSVGLGGNGQFVRLRALQSLGSAPWTRCLTEDLDLGLSLVERGWRNRFCPRACVAQQALNDIRPFLRQRTRWIQGHYSCWSHLPSLWKARKVRLSTKLDLSLYLVLVAFIPVLGAQFLIGVGELCGLYATDARFLEAVSGEGLRRALVLGLSLGPLAAFWLTYQRFAALRLPWWALPGIFTAFAIYGYLWALPASVRALGRIALRRGAWVKTPRTPVGAHDIAAEVSSLARLG